MTQMTKNMMTGVTVKTVHVYSAVEYLRFGEV